MSALRSLVRRPVIVALERSGGLESFFELRRTWRRRVRSARGRWSSSLLRRQLGTEHEPVVSRDGTAMIADIEPRYVAHERMIENLVAVSRVLRKHGVEFALCPTQTAQRYRVAVDAVERARVWRALGTLASQSSAYVAFSDASTRRLRPLRTYGSKLPTDGAISDVWSYFRAVTDGVTTVIGLEHACDIEFWSRTAVDTSDEGDIAVRDDDSRPVLSAPRSNLVSRTMPPAARKPEEVEIGSPSFPSWQPFAQAFSSIGQRFPIDVVYTWVDDTDPDWIARRAASYNHDLFQSSDGNEAARFANRDELRYSLRSLDAFADFVRHVYLVTDQQRPTWLVDTDDLTVIDHRDIFDVDAALPTFNSHAIESRLHHIEGLSEHYLYMNDDVFFGRRVTPASFFEPSGASKFYLSKAKVPPGPPVPNEPSVSSAAKNGRDLLFNSHGYAPTQKMKHTPHPQRRSTLHEMEGLYSDEFKQLQQHQFRTEDDISMASSLHHHYGYITGRAVPGSIRYQYVNLAADNLPDRLDDLVSGRWDTFCLNDAVVPDSLIDTVNRIVADWLPRAFPFTSRFERPTG